MAIDNILLTSEDFVRNATGISDNISGKYLGVAIREAQEGGLRSILGDELTDKVKSLVKSGEVRNAGNEAYASLLDECQFYLAFRSAAELVPIVSYKVANMGVVRTEDEKVASSPWDEVMMMSGFFQAKADRWCASLQRWVLSHRSEFPELSETTCYQLKANLTSAGSCGLWLGGMRGKRGL